MSSFDPWASDEIHKELADGTFGRVQTLIEGGADVNTSTSWGITPLMRRAEQGQPKFVKALIAAGADTTRRAYLNTVWSGDALQFCDKFQRGDYINCIRLLENPAAAKAEFAAERAKAEAAGVSLGEWYETHGDGGGWMIRCGWAIRWWLWEGSSTPMAPWLWKDRAHPWRERGSKQVFQHVG